jgi:hypothetical protein
MQEVEQLDANPAQTDGNNISTIQTAWNVEENPKFRQVEAQLRDREAEMERISGYATELEGRLQKLLGDFSLFRGKAQ